LQSNQGKTVIIPLVGSGKEKENSYIGLEVNGKNLMMMLTVLKPN